MNDVMILQIRAVSFIVLFLFSKNQLRQAEGPHYSTNLRP